MAEEMNVNHETMETVGAEVETSVDRNNQDSTPDISELMAQLAEERARAEKAERNEKRIKIAYDKAASDLAEKKKEERARMTSEEQEQAEILETIKKLEEENKSLKDERNLTKAVAAYKGIIDDSKIEVLIEAVNERDHDAIANLFKTTADMGEKRGEAKYLKNRTPVAAGSGSGTMTMDEIMAIKDIGERQRAIAQNFHLFE